MCTCNEGGEGRARIVGGCVRILFLSLLSLGNSSFLAEVWEAFE